MNVVNFNERSCERYRRYFDAYLDNEVLVETSQDVLQHLGSCVQCTRAIQSRAELKERVKNAVTADVAPLQLVETLRDRLRSDRRSFVARDTAHWMMAVAAVLLLAIGAGVLQWGRFEDCRRTSVYGESSLIHPSDINE